MEFDYSSQVRSKTNEELTDIFLNQEQYQKPFVELALAEMKARNLPLETISKIKEENMELKDEKLLLGKPGNPIYLGICFALCLVGGIPGVVAGYIYAFSKTKNSQGEELHVYNKSTRDLGLLMCAIGTLILLVSVFKSMN